MPRQHAQYRRRPIQSSAAQRGIGNETRGFEHTMSRYKNTPYLVRLVVLLHGRHGRRRRFRLFERLKHGGKKQGVEKKRGATRNTTTANPKVSPRLDEVSQSFSLSLAGVLPLLSYVRPKGIPVTTPTWRPGEGGLPPSLSCLRNLGTRGHACMAKQHHRHGHDRNSQSLLPPCASSTHKRTQAAPSLHRVGFPTRKK